MAEAAAAPPRALLLDPSDNVAVAVADLVVGERIAVGDRSVTLQEAIGFGHKLALVAIDQGGSVHKYAEVIGRANATIAAGAHVHVHNLVSARLPGPGDPRR